MKIYARNCEIVDISKDTLIQFLNENHSQGYANSIVNYGLIYKDELVQVMSFGKPRFNKFYSWELIRDCTKSGVEVVGGVSKLWKHFIDNNTVRSCICYSYPHESAYTNKYVDYCGFTNLEKVKPSKKVYFEGVWNGKIKRIDKSILERHGVDRLLKGNFGHDRTNEEILLELGFKRKTEDGLSPQVDSYFPSGIVYKITDLDTGKFYIGETLKQDEFINGIYNGSGNKWVKYYNKYKDTHSFKREILKKEFKTPKELYEFEVNEIRKYCNKIEDGKYVVNHDTGCMNVKTQMQPEMPICPECGGVLYIHYKTCSKYNPPAECPECGGKWNHHKTSCSRYKKNTPCPICGSYTTHKKDCKYYSVKVCPECGGKLGRHYKTCSMYKPQSICPICGKINGHLRDCPNIKICPECGGKGGNHLKTCSKYKFTISDKICEECGGKGGKHKSGCSKKKTTICPECGGKSGKHKSSCSKAKKCPECGYLLQSNKHAKTCSHYKEFKK